MTIKLFMKKAQKQLAALLMMTVLTCTVLPNMAYASVQTTGDLFRENYTESINYEGVNYTYHYFYKDGKPTITITNDSNTSVDELVFDQKSSNIYLNDEPFASFKSVQNSLVKGSLNSNPRSGYEFIGSDSTEIDWPLQCTVVVWAGIVSGALLILTGLTGLTATGVIGSVGAGTIAGIVGISGGGIVTASLWQQVNLWEINYKVAWGIDINNKYYGDYTNYLTVSPTR